MTLAAPAASAVAAADRAWDRLVACTGATLPVVVLAVVPALQYAYWQWTALVLTTPVVTWGAAPIHRAALAAARRAAVTPETLVALATLGTYCWSLWAMVFGGAGSTTHVHPFSAFSARADGVVQISFEVAAGGVTLMLLGQHLRDVARRRSEARLAAVRATLLGTAALRRSTAGAESVRPADLQVGDVVVVPAGAPVPVDGEVVGGVAGTLPTGTPLLAGQVLDVGPVEVRADAVGDATVLATALDAPPTGPESGGSPARRLADRAGAGYVAAVLGVGAATAGFWVGAGTGGSTPVAAAAAVLLVASPAALALAVPAALGAGVVGAARRGVLVVGAGGLEAAGRIDTVVLGRGVLTRPTGQVIDVVPAADTDRDDVLPVAAALEAAARHRVAGAVTVAAAEQTVFWPAVTDVTVVDGAGVRGTTGARVAVVGRPDFVAEAMAAALPAELATAVRVADEDGHTAVVLGWDGATRAVVEVIEAARPDAADAVARLRAMGQTPVLLTGGRAGPAQVLARELGIDVVAPEARAEGKVEVLRRLRADGRGVAVVADATRAGRLLAEADLRIATDGPLGDAADLLLLRSEPGLVADAVRIARRCHGVLEGNLAWALGYPLAAVPLAAAGVLNPLVAALLGLVAALLVTANTARLRR